MNVLTRICIKDWDVTAANGDHFEVKRGNEYTTSVDLDDGTCMVFRNFWVRVPLHHFGGAKPL